jgi:hypothetical protein
MTRLLNEPPGTGEIQGERKDQDPDEAGAI